MYLVSFIGVFIFSGLTAYDMQYLKRMRDSASFSPEQYEKIALYGALKLYLDFIISFSQSSEAVRKKKIGMKGREPSDREGQTLRMLPGETKENQPEEFSGYSFCRADLIIRGNSPPVLSLSAASARSQNGGSLRLNSVPTLKSGIL
jgi:hypothetical protein